MFQSNVLVLIFWIILLSCILGILTDTTWRMIIVSKYMIDVANFTGNFRSNVRVEYYTRPRVSCGSSCDANSWCHTWCLDQDIGVCVHSNALVSPNYVADVSAPNYKCYSQEDKNLFLGPGITTKSGPLWGFYTAGMNMAKNLVSGVNNFAFDMSCVGAGNTSGNPWVLIDMGVPQVIHEIRVMTQQYSGEKWSLPHGAEVRVGLSPPISANPFSHFGNFSNLDLFGILPNPCFEFTTYKIASPKGKIGRFISLQKLLPGDTFLAVCGITAF